MRLRLNSGNLSVTLDGSLGCAGEETSLELTGLTFNSDRPPQMLREFRLSREEGPAVALGEISPQIAPRIELWLDKDDLCQT